MNQGKRRPHRERRLIWETLEGREVLSAGVSGSLSAMTMTSMHGHAQIQVQGPKAALSLSPSPLTLTGRLAASHDDGASSEDGITSQRRPVFEGTSAPNAEITLHARKLLRGSRFVLGRTRADADGDWRIASGTLGLGKYTVQAMASANGATRSLSLYPFGHPIVIVPGPIAVR